MKTHVVCLLALLLTRAPAPAADDSKDASTNLPVTVVLGPGQATAMPVQQGKAHTGGGNIHVTQPAPDTIWVTMTGVVAAGGHPLRDSVAGINFDLAQDLEVVFHSRQVKGAKLILWGRTVGLLRSHSHCVKNDGSADICTPGHASVCRGPAELLALDLPARSVAGGQNLSIHDREGPVWVSVGPGKYTLHQAFAITASHRKSLFGNPASAEFAPDPALEADWIGKREPFHGAAKKDFGFQIILKVVADEAASDNKEKQSAP